MHIDPTDPIRGVPEPTSATGKASPPPDVSRDALLGSGVPAEVVDAVWRQEGGGPRVYSNRSRAIEEALEEKLSRMERRRLAEECARLDPDEERALAEEGLQDAAWPGY